MYIWYKALQRLDPPLPHAPRMQNACRDNDLLGNTLRLYTQAPSLQQLRLLLVTALPS